MSIPSEAPLPNGCGCQDCRVATVMGIPMNGDSSERAEMLAMLMTAAYKLGRLSGLAMPTSALMFQARAHALATFEESRAAILP